MNDTVLLNISIDGSIDCIWSVLVNKNEFNKCFENIEIECDNWKVGGVIKFKSEINQNIKIDEAIIRTISENHLLSYGYKKQGETNVIEVSFTLKNVGVLTYLTIEGKNFKDSFERSHSENTWINMMQQIKQYVQKK
jgi:hypothetical protein